MNANHTHTIDAQQSASDVLDSLVAEFCGREPSSALATRLGTVIGPRNAYRIIRRACRVTGFRPGYYGIMIAANGEDRSGSDPLAVRNPALGIPSSIKGFFRIKPVSRLSGRALA